MKHILLSIVLPIICYAGQSLYYTPSRIAFAKENIKKYAWAKKIHDRIMTGDKHNYYIGADYTSALELVKKSDNFIWELQPDTTIGRFIPVETKALCPKCGPAARNVNYYCPWSVDPLNKPYKIQCRNCKYYFPDEKYPDDGNGIKIGNKKYYMLREYAHFVYMSYVGPGIAALSQAYLLTGNKEFARKACILLSKVALVYPNYEDRFTLTWYGETGGQDPRTPQHKGGLISDRIWECFALNRFALGFDAIKNYPESDPNLLKYLQTKGIKVKNNEEWKAFIRNSIFITGAKALFSKMIRGNDGMHQASALAIALALNNHSKNNRPNSKDLVNFVYHWDGFAANVINNVILPDGGGHESPGYNGLRLEYIKVARLMEAIKKAYPKEYPNNLYPSIWASEKGERFFEFFDKIILSGVSTPSIGDSAGRYPFQNTLKMPRMYSALKPEHYFFAANQYNNPTFATALLKNGQISGGELWEKVDENKLKQLAKQATKNTNVKQNRLLDSSGIAILESGKVPECRTVMLNYTGVKEHWQADALSINLHAFGMEHLRDVGYPVSWNYCRHFDYHNLAHNTVTVNENFQDGGIGQCLLYFDLPNFSGISASHSANNQKRTKDGKQLVSLFRRTVLKLDLPDNNFYCVDIFDVNGGTQHDQSWHSLPVELVLPKLAWKKQSKGTMAGINVPEFGSWTDQWGNRRCDVPSFVTNIKRASFNQTCAWTWKSNLSTQEVFRIHPVPYHGKLEAIVGSGRTPVWPKGKKIDFLFLRRITKHGEPTRFITILEPYKGAPVIKSIKLKSTNPNIIEVNSKYGNDVFTISPIKNKEISITLTSKTPNEKKQFFIGKKYFRTKIKTTNLASKQFTVTNFTGADQVLKPGTKCRIYNAVKSNIFTISKVEKQKDSYLLTIAEYPLIAKAKCSRIINNSLQLDADLAFARYTNLGKHGTIYVGAKFDAPNLPAYQIAAAQDNGLITPLQKLSIEQQKSYIDKTISIWQFGINDTLEIAEIRSSK